MAGLIRMAYAQVNGKIVGVYQLVGNGASIELLAMPDSPDVGITITPEKVGANVPVAYRRKKEDK